MRANRPGMAACLILALALMAACGSDNTTASPATGTPDAATGLNVGQQAPDFTVELVSGQTVTLQSLHGKVLLVNFWATWCAPCRQEMPFFQQLADRYDKDFQVLAINYQEQATVITKYTTQIGLKFDVGLDLKGKINRLYGVNQYPVSYVIGRDGTILARQAGPFNPLASLETSLKHWIAGS